VKYAFEAACKELGIELKGPMDEQTRHAAKALLRCGAEILADLGWGWRYAASDAGQAVMNVFGYRSHAAKLAAGHGQPEASQAAEAEAEMEHEEAEMEHEEAEMEHEEAEMEHEEAEMEHEEEDNG
jgi:hypothetical protein